MQIPFCKISVDEREVEAVSKVLRSGWWTGGPVGTEFEKKFAEFVGSKYAVFVNSCTAALGLSLQWYKKSFMHEQRPFNVYVPSMTFAATVNEVVLAGCQVNFGDVGSDLCLKWDLKDYDCAIPVHLTGNKAFTGYPFPVIEDSAHRIIEGQCKDNDNLVCFSFYATKNMSTGEGGMIATNDKKAYEWFLQARHHGISKGGWDRYAEGGSWRYDIEFPGWKANQSDIMAALGIVQLEKLPEFNKQRQHVIDEYNKAFGYSHSGLHLYPVLVEDRSSFIETLKQEGIQCSVHFLPIHKMSWYAGNYVPNLPVTEWFGERLVSLPLYPSMTDEEIQRVCTTALRTNQVLPWSVSVS